MQSNLRSLTFALAAALLTASLAHAADSPFFSTAVGTVQKLEKETLTVSLGEKSKKTVQLKVTGTSNFYLLTPQVRAGKTVMTQRTATAADVVKGQAIAVIYTDVDKAEVLLDAVLKSAETEKK